jgi:hypothetical protein
MLVIILVRGGVGVIGSQAADASLAKLPIVAASVGQNARRGEYRRSCSHRSCRLEAQQSDGVPRMVGVSP